MTNDPLAISVPKPNEMFLSRVVHPANINATQRAISNRERLLKPKQFKAFAARLKDLDQQLIAASFHEHKTEWEQLRDEIIQTRLDAQVRLQTHREHWHTYNEEQKGIARFEMRDYAEQIQLGLGRMKVLENTAAPYMGLYRQQRAITERIKEHHRAVEREKLHNQLRLEMGKEVWAFADAIISRLSQLGYRHEVLRGKRRWVKLVEFDEIHVTPDRIFFKIKSTQKAVFGFRSALPDRVRMADLVSEETCKELSTAVQRQVTSEFTLTNGAWLIVNRLGTRDGILEYITQDQIMSRYPHEDRHKLPVPIGVGQGREVWNINISEHPHFLIGGSTGGGKSNIENVLITTLIQKHSPDEVRLLLIDLKEGLEFKRYENIPHLIDGVGVVKEIEAAAQVLVRLEQMRKERANELGKYWARDIDEYNDRCPPEKRMARIIVLFDEYAAIQINRELEKQIQSVVMQLLNKGRATGIHVILCTQNPSVDIVPGPSKANMAFRLCGPMPTKAASMTVLGTGDAYDLPNIKGRMLAMVGRTLWTVQTPHSRNEDIERALEAAMSYTASKPVEFPALDEDQAMVGVTEERIIEIALMDFGGDLKASKILAILKGEISQRELYRMVKAITAKSEVIYRGETYTPKNQPGNFFKLVKV